MAEIDLYSTFDRFKEHLPTGGDLTMMILKGHLLIEEQVWLLISNRVASGAALEGAKLSTLQKLCLAEALIDDFSRSVQNGCYSDEYADWLWPALKKLNTLRNNIAHNLTASGINDRIRDFVARCPEKLGTTNLCDEFEYALWNACAEVHHLINPVSLEDFENLP